MKGSVQLRNYLRARRSGVSREGAAAAQGIGLEEARLHDEADAAGEYADIDLSEPETAGSAVTPFKELTVKQDAMIDVDPEEHVEDALLPGDDDVETTLPVADLAADTLRGDVRDAFLSWFKATPKPWSAMSEKEQRGFADAADRAARNLVHQACRFIAANERVTIVATLVEYKEKDGVEAKLKLASKGEIVAALHEACGREVLIVTSGEEEFAGETAPAVIDADQPQFPTIGAEYDDALDRVIEDVNGGALGAGITASRVREEA